MGHRYADFGRIFILIFLCNSLIKFRKVIFTKKVKQLLLLAITSVAMIAITSLIATNTMGHRYFIVSFLTLALLAFYVINKYYKRKSTIYALLFLGLLSGNLWIYPRDIAQGWDASLAHLPYHSLRTEAIDYLDRNEIALEDTASFFPNAISLDKVDLSGDERAFLTFDGNNPYLCYSNVYNLTDEEYEIIDNNYTIIKKFEKARVHIYIYKRNTYENN